MTDSQYDLFTAFPALNEYAGLALVLLMGYLFVGLLMGCPYCLYPDMAWPATLLRAGKQRVMDR